MNAIFEATKRRCIEEQENARDAHLMAHCYRRDGLLGRACQEQREVRYHADQAMTRLFRLIGTE